MASFLLLLVNIWTLGGLILWLHYQNPRLGFAPLLLVIGALTVFVQIRWSIYIEPTAGLILFLTSNGLVPVLLMTVLVMYVANGAVPARLTIYGIAGTTLLVLAWMVIARLHLSLPNGGTFSGLERDALVPSLDLRVTFGSFIAFIADMFVIAVFYQGVKNSFHWMPEMITVGLALLASLWTDAIIFHLVVDYGRPDFAELLADDVVGKTLSTFALWPMLAIYLSKIAPTMTDHVGGANRPTFDLLFGSFSEIKLALVKTQAALEESEEQRLVEVAYRQQIIDHISEGLWLAAPNTHYAFYVNPAYERIWGYSATHICNNQNCFVDSLHPDDRERIINGLPQQLTGSYEAEYRIVRPDGETRWIRDRAFPVKDEDGQVYRIVGIAEDITERKRSEKEHLELTTERERVKLLRDFISHASHDLKSPLAAINLKAHHARLTQDPVKRDVHLRGIEGLVERMTTIIDDLLMLARLENIDDLAVVEIDLAEIIRDCTESLRTLADHKQIELRVKTTPGCLPMRAVPNDLARAITNLVANAIHYTPAGGQVNVEHQVNLDEVVIRISDTGIGIPEEARPFIFNRFYRANNAREMSGTGLGLSIVQKVVNLHQGQIEVESSVGVGTAFTITLPLVTEKATFQSVSN